MSMFCMNPFISQSCRPSVVYIPAASDVTLTSRVCNVQRRMQCTAAHAIYSGACNVQRRMQCTAAHAMYSGACNVQRRMQCTAAHGALTAQQHWQLLINVRMNKGAYKSVRLHTTEASIINAVLFIGASVMARNSKNKTNVENRTTVLHSADQIRSLKKYKSNRKLSYNANVTLTGTSIHNNIIK